MKFKWGLIVVGANWGLVATCDGEGHGRLMARPHTALCKSMSGEFEWILPSPYEDISEKT